MAWLAIDSDSCPACFVFSFQESAYRVPVASSQNDTDSGRAIGYARVSSAGRQDLALQLDALKKHGVVDSLMFTDRISGAKENRPGLDACLAELKTGDILVVWRLDRLGRSVRHLVSLIDDLRERGIGFRSLCDGAIDTTTASGELIFNIFSSLAQFERRLIQERTKAGLAAARARGRMGGRRPITFDNRKVQLAQALYRDRTMEIAEICSSLEISRTTLYRYLKLKPDSDLLKAQSNN